MLSPHMRARSPQDIEDIRGRFRVAALTKSLDDPDRRHRRDRRLSMLAGRLIQRLAVHDPSGPLLQPPSPSDSRDS